MMRETYLKENHRGVYSAFLLKGTLKEHLLTIQKQAEERMEKLTSQMAATEGVTEQLKETDQMLWVAKMNSIRNRAEEVVLGRLLQSVADTDDLLRGEAPEPTFTQLSLFPSFEEQVGTVAAAEASMKYTMPAAFSLPQNELETILRSGGGKQHSRKRIFAKYTEGRNAEQMVDFLKNEYGQTGKGFEINGNPVSVWFDEHGMSVGYGTQAKGKHHLFYL